MIRERLQVNHALAADVYHTAERGGWASPPARAPDGANRGSGHARQAGRHDALAGEDLAAASGHVSAFPALLAAYQAGYAEGEEAHSRSAPRPAARPLCGPGLIVRDDLDRAFHAQDEWAIHDAVDAICWVAERYPAFRLRFFDDVPERAISPGWPTGSSRPGRSGTPAAGATGHSGPPRGTAASAAALRQRAGERGDRRRRLA
ncbi:hypothetical protein [Burkholderia gladioli]|uniref:hypothetical protein n=1 Tax=Burkholderia gladioli TaxID=28095 RepID=UPI000FDBD533|nr:hypothetical protein [Burkholderia gladioli]